MATKPNELTPMRRQYNEIKERNQDCILFFRLGDFYEMFDEDAKLAARELDLTLTTRDRNKPVEEQTPMWAEDIAQPVGEIFADRGHGIRFRIAGTDSQLAHVFCDSSFGDSFAHSVQLLCYFRSAVYPHIMLVDIENLLFYAFLPELPR